MKSFIHQAAQGFIIKMIRISVILIVKDETSIDQTLDQLYNQMNTTETEIIVVDASEGRLSEISQKYSQVIWIDFRSINSRKKITIAEQRNFGVHASNGQVIVFCDAGGTPQSGWLNAITDPLLSGKQFLVGGPLRATNPSSLDSWTNLQQEGDEIQYPTTANMALTRSAFALVGGFNEDLDYGSDADLVWRLNTQGIKQICIEKAVMGLDGGTKKRELIRAWRYGKALAALLLLHPKKRLPKAKSNPEIWIYPALTAMVFLSLPLFGLSKYLAFTFLTVNLLLAIRNLKTKHPVQVLARHYVYGWGFCYQLLRKKWPWFKLSEVLIYPSDDIRYLNELHQGFKLAEEKSPTVAPFPKLTFLNSFNIFILPFFSPLLRMRGAKIVHIHWIYRFKLIWLKGKIPSIFIQYWFYFWVISLKICRIQIVYTIHNTVPHERIFNNDKKAFQYLENSADLLILLNEPSFKTYSRMYSKKQVQMIPEGPLRMPTTIDRAEFRKRLQVAESKQLIVLAGYLRPYKGISSLLEGAAELQDTFAIRVAGFADRQYQTELELILLKLKSKNIDIDIVFRYLTDEEYGAYLNAADFVCVPFKEINNSGSINSALCSGVPIIVPNIPSLDWVPKGAVLNIPVDFDGNFDFRKLFKLITQISVSEYNSMSESALQWATTFSWQDVAKQHIDLYADLGGENNENYARDKS